MEIGDDDRKSVEFAGFICYDKFYLSLWKTAHFPPNYQHLVDIFVDNIPFIWTIRNCTMGLMWIICRQPLFFAVVVPLVSAGWVKE